jgi:hypothetical protein
VRLHWGQGYNWSPGNSEHLFYEEEQLGRQTKKCVSRKLTSKEPSAVGVVMSVSLNEISLSGWVACPSSRTSDQQKSLIEDQALCRNLRALLEPSVRALMYLLPMTGGDSSRKEDWIISTPSSLDTDHVLWVCMGRAQGYREGLNLEGFGQS